MKRTSEKKHWDDFWAATGKLQDIYGTDDRIVENLAKHVTLVGLRVLEVGAGTGRDADALASHDAIVHALDYSEQSLSLMKGSLRNPVRVVCGDAFSLPFRDESFDVVYHQGLLEHFKNPGVMLEEHVRVLKKGGTLLVDVPQRYHYYTLLKHALIFFGKWFAGWETEFSAAELRRLVEARGLVVMGMYGHSPSPPIWYRGARRLLLKIGLRLPMYPRLGRFWPFQGSVVPEKLRVNTAMVIGCVARKR